LEVRGFSTWTVGRTTTWFNFCFAEPFEFVVLTDLMSAKIALNLLWHFSSTIPYKNPSLYQKRLVTNFHAEVFAYNLSSHVLPMIPI